MIKVTVIIVNWNKKNLLNNCLTSLENQMFKDFDILVVDNGSTDGSIQLLRENYPTVNLIELGKNTGFCHANNIGIQNAKSEYIALLNNDTEVDKNWLNELVEVLDKNEKYSFASSKMICLNDKSKIDRVADSFTTCCFMFGLGAGDDAENEYTKPFEILGVCGGAAFFRKKVFDKIGGFDERYFAYLEDLDLNLRMLHAGFKGIYVPTAKVYHLGGGTSDGMRNPMVIRNTVRNLWFTLSKNIPISVGFKIAPRVLIYHFYWMIKFKCFWRYVFAWLGYVVQEPRVYPDRFRIMRGSVLSSKDFYQILLREDTRVFDYLNRQSLKTTGKEMGKFWRWLFHQN